MRDRTSSAVTLSTTGAGAGSRYQPIAELGQGGMADVLLAMMRGAAGFTKLVVLKRLRPNLADDPELLVMFCDEARLAARLNHPNVVQTHEVGYDAGRHFIAMEWLDGQPLHRLLKAAWASEALPLDLHLFILCEALRGLHHAHELQDFDGTRLEVVHRDVSPQNVFVTYEGQVKLVDFGVAKAHARSTDTQVGVIKGKVAYMAPEQAQGCEVDRRADVFSVGVMLWEAVARRRLWRGLGTSEIAAALAERRIPRLSETVPNAPHGLDAICARALAASPHERYSTAAELGQAIEGVLEGLGRSIDSRRIGAIVHGLFADERARVRRVIEEQLGHVRLDSVVAPLPTSLPDLGERPSQAGTPSSPRASLELTVRESPNDASMSRIGRDARRRRHTLVGAGVALALLFGVVVTVAVARTPHAARQPSISTARSGSNEIPAKEVPTPFVAAEPPPVTPPIASSTRSTGERREPARTAPDRFEERTLERRPPGTRRAPRTLDKEDPWD